MKLRPCLAGVASLVPSDPLLPISGQIMPICLFTLLRKSPAPGLLPLRNRRITAERPWKPSTFFNLYHQVEVRIGDGLLALKEEDGVEVVVIAGLGGKTICKMLIAAGHQASGL